MIMHALIGTVFQLFGCIGAGGSLLKQWFICCAIWMRSTVLLLCSVHIETCADGRMPCSILFHGEMTVPDCWVQFWKRMKWQRLVLGLRCSLQGIKSYMSAFFYYGGLQLPNLMALCQSSFSGERSYLGFCFAVFRCDWLLCVWLSCMASIHSYSPRPLGFFAL